MGNKFISCDWLEHGIIFDHENVIRVCCSQCNEGGGRPVLRGQYYGEKLDWDRIFELKREMRNVQRTGQTYEKCRGCILLREDEWDDEDYINRLLLTHWINCNCKCVYCPAVRDEKLKANNRHYNIIPTLQEMCDRGILKKNAYISIAGGESTIYPEFEDMLHLLLDYGCDNILVNSSGIKYSPAIAKGITEQKVQLTISIDSGTQETYEKIKLVKTYDNIIESLSKYSEAQIYNKDMVCSKFIIVPGFNDREEEIEAWIENTAALGLKHVSIDVDLRWIHEHFDNLKNERRIYDLIVFTQKAAERENLILRYDERASIMRKIHKIDTAIFGGTMQRIKG
ncbi:MAG: radical SAM protein [Candidatus Gastranaerophilales bacterium]|nr:radical SAM protein [Candidatus Gastranaerophilales bacterium]